jgi:copper chaperone CopZ
MSCGHCVAAVKRAIESVPGVRADVSIGSATIESEKDVIPIDAIRDAIEDEGYFAEVAQEK